MRTSFVSNAQPAETPSVGVFWGVPDALGRTVIIGQASAQIDSETYGAFLTFASGHLEVWDSWRRLGPHALSKRGLPNAVAWHEYEEFPRGRVVYLPAQQRFIIYADRRLRMQTLIEEIKMTFHLRAAKGGSVRQLARVFGVSKATIGRIPPSKVLETDDRY